MPAADGQIGAADEVLTQLISNIVGEQLTLTPTASLPSLCVAKVQRAALQTWGEDVGLAIVRRLTVKRVSELPRSTSVHAVDNVSGVAGSVLHLRVVDERERELGDWHAINLPAPGLWNPIASE